MDKILAHLENLVNNETNRRTQQKDYSLTLEIATTENKFLQWVWFGNNPQMEREEMTHTQGFFSKYCTCSTKILRKIFPQVNFRLLSKTMT